MPSSGFFNTVDSDPKRNGFLWEDFSDVKSTFVVSPCQSIEHLPEYDPDYPWPQPPSTANCTVVSLNLNANTHFDAHDWSTQPDVQSAQYYTPVSDLQDSWLMPTVIPTTHESSATLNAGRASMSQGYSSVVVNGASSVHNASYSPPNHFSPPNIVPSHHNNSPMFAHQTRPFNSETETLNEQILPGLTLSSSPIPSSLAFRPIIPRPPIQERIQRRNSRRGSSVTNSPYPPIRASSLPVQAIPLEEMISHICQWVKDDGTICGAQIARASVSKHLTTHGIEKLAHNYRVPCKWVGCQIRGNKDLMNRESIVRHVREKHLGYRRTL